MNNVTTTLGQLLLLLAACAPFALAQLLRQPAIYYPSRVGVPQNRFFAPDASAFGFGGFAGAGNPFYYRSSPPAASLFTPNTVQQPAETPGQLENYRKALEEEAREAADDEAQRYNNNNGFGGHGGFGRSFVNVQIAGQDQYAYTT